MYLQDVIWTIALTGMSLVALGFLLIIFRASKQADEATRAASNATARKLKTWMFGILLLIFVSGSWATLHDYPIVFQDGSSGQQAVTVVGRMWSWDVIPDTIRTGVPIEFQVTSEDVNHGFAIYDPNGRILSQTQAMPGYTNRLHYTFSQPGTYTIQCLEFCGMGHAPMSYPLEVVAKGGM
ncbi:MAG: hypothetical protein J5I53_03445 [Bradyrhizobiaceae bacterium]|nr:hypothetical protein [Bradyrhizobiaceae bacterium]